MITCTSCRYFRPDAINPSAGMGKCFADARHGYWHPDAKHSCKDFSDTPDIAKQKQADG